MANLSWFANSASVDITVGATTNVIAALKNVSIKPHFEVTELYGVGGIHRAAAWRHTYSVDVSCEYAMWATDAEYLLSSFLAGGYLASPQTTTFATDENLEGQREKVAIFNITASVWDTSNCDRKMSATVYGVYFNDMSVMDVSENGFVTRNISGKGESVAFYYKYT